MSVVVVLQPRLWHFYGKVKVGRDSIFDITRPQIWTPTNGWDRDMKPSLAIKDHSIDKLFLWGGDWYPLLSHQTHIRQTYHLLIGRWSVWFHTCSPGKKQIQEQCEECQTASLINTELLIGCYRRIGITRSKTDNTNFKEKA